MIFRPSHSSFTSQPPNLISHISNQITEKLRQWIIVPFNIATSTILCKCAIVSLQMNQRGGEKSGQKSIKNLSSPLHPRRRSTFFLGSEGFRRSISVPSSSECNGSRNTCRAGTPSGSLCTAPATSLPPHYFQLLNGSQEQTRHSKTTTLSPPPPASSASAAPNPNPNLVPHSTAHTGSNARETEISGYQSTDSHLSIDSRLIVAMSAFFSLKPTQGSI